MDGDNLTRRARPLPYGLWPTKTPPLGLENGSFPHANRPTPPPHHAPTYPHPARSAARGFRLSAVCAMPSSATHRGAKPSPGAFSTRSTPLLLLLPLTIQFVHKTELCYNEPIQLGPRSSGKRYATRCQKKSYPCYKKTIKPHNRREKCIVPNSYPC